MSKGSGGGSTVSRVEPSTLQAPYLSDVYRQAQTLGGTPRQMFPDSFFARPTETQLIAEEGLRQTATGPLTDIQNMAFPALNFQLGGGANALADPNLARVVNAAISPVKEQAQDLIQQVTRNEVATGNLGSTRGSEVKARIVDDFNRAAGDISAGILSDAYQQANKRQFGILGSLPSILPSFSAANRLLSDVGAVEQGRIQQGIDEARGRFEFAQQEPFNRLNQYSGLIQSNILPGTTTQTAGGPSDSQKLLGGGLTGLGTYGALQSGTFGSVFAGAGTAAGGASGGALAGANPYIAGTLALLSILD